MIQRVTPTRDSIIGRALHIRAEIQQLFDDAAHWNSIRPAHEHIDPDPDGQLKAQVEEIDRFLTEQGAA